MGTILFGREMQEFSTFGRAFLSCFIVLLGDFDVDSLYTSGHAMALIWFLTFQILTVMIMLNMLLAIIMDTYSEVKGSLSLKKTVWAQSYIMFQRWHEIKRGKSLP